MRVNQIWNRLLKDLQYFVLTSHKFRNFEEVVSYLILTWLDFTEFVNILYKNFHLIIMWKYNLQVQPFESGIVFRFHTWSSAQIWSGRMRKNGKKEKKQALVDDFFAFFHTSLPKWRSLPGQTPAGGLLGSSSRHTISVCVCKERYFNHPNKNEFVFNSCWKLVCVCVCVCVSNAFLGIELELFATFTVQFHCPLTFPFLL